MFVTTERLNNSNNLIVVDEIGRFIGEIDDIEFYSYVIIPKSDFVEDGVLYHKIDRKEFELRKEV